MGFSLKQIKEIIDDSDPALKNALIQQEKKLHMEVHQKTAPAIALNPAILSNNFNLVSSKNLSETIVP